MRRFLDTLVAALILLAPLAAQDDEARFRSGQADKLNKFAQQAFDKGFPRQARLIWLQTIKLYDPGSEDAHKGLGHVRAGNSWAPNPDFEYPLDDTGSSKDGASLFKAYEKLKEDLASGHRRQAQKWAKADRTDKANEHYGMVLRWVKDDREAQEALEHRDVGGVTGTELEQTLYDRSKLIEKARDRWYVPDPNKQADLDQIRERALLKEFEEINESSQRRIKQFRTEAVRAGFKACWQERDYATIVKVAAKLPEAVLQEDEKLLMYIDNAQTRLGDDA